MLTFTNSKGQGVYYDPELFPLVSFNSWKYTYASIGVNLSGITLEDYYPSSYNLFLASEVKLGNKTTLGPKIGFWITYNYFAMGGSFIYYIKDGEKATVLRPEIGAERNRFKLVYGYNFKLKKSSLNDFNTHLFELTYLFRRTVYSSKTHRDDKKR